MSFFLIVILFFSGNYLLLANEKSEKLSDLKTHINDVNQNIEQINTKRNNLSTQLGKIERQYGQTARSLRTLTKKINTQRRRLKEITKEIKSRRKKLAVENHELNGQIKATYIMGKKEKLKLLLNQQDPALASRMIMYYHYLNKARLTQLITIKNNIAILSELGQEKQQEKQQLRQISHLKKKQQTQLIKTKKKRKHLLSSLNKDLSLKSEQLTQLKGDERQLRNLIVSLGHSNMDDRNNAIVKDNKPKLSNKNNKKSSYTSLKLPFHQLKGKLPWPLKGKMMKKFGSKRVDGHWDGVLIVANEGINIQSVAEGKVIYADWLRGYGLLVIINHGSGYMSLYAFNQSLNKKVGDKVTTGEIIASVGKSGGRSQSGLYFGIRYQGKPVNPSLWCKKIRKGYIG